VKGDLEETSRVWTAGQKKHIAAAIPEISIVSTGYQRKYA
jgi:hypothetical protein